ncbi:MAG: hypothetical protein SO032_06530 [Bifidobacterium pseudolongum]|nr:hypothetical protein [Bifidobacterium pseudolongum]
MFLWVPQLCALAFLALIVRFDRRSLWSGFALFVLIMTVGVTAACLFVDTMDLVPSQWIRTVMLWIGLLAAAVIAAFPVLLGVFLTAEGCRLLRREGVSPANCLSLAAGLFVLLDLTLIPYLASLVRNAAVTWLFALASACVLFFSAQLAIYCLSAFVNLVHVGKPRGLRQIVVLGSGIFGTAVPPLLGNRIRKGIQLQHDAPHAVLILSGGQGARRRHPRRARDDGVGAGARGGPVADDRGRTLAQHRGEPCILGTAVPRPHRKDGNRLDTVPRAARAALAHGARRRGIVDHAGELSHAGASPTPPRPRPQATRGTPARRARLGSRCPRR